MNKKLLVLSIAVLAVTALFAGSQTIRSINNETTQSVSTTVNEADNITTVASDSSEVLQQESDKAVKPVAAAEEQSPSAAASQPERKKISAAEAEAVALEKAGFAASEVYDKEIELDYENGVLVYEVSFDKDRTDYDYVIDAASGEILHSKVDPEGEKAVTEAAKKEEKPAAEENKQPTTSAAKAESRISVEEAESIALKKAGFSASEVYDKEVELDYERGSWVYEVSFEKDRTDYDYVIDAASGEILRSKVDPEGEKAVTEAAKKEEKPASEENKQSSSSAKNEKPENRISAKEAEAIALKKAGLSASEVREKETELDYERGVWVYEVSFEKGITDYEYVIDAVSGEILHSEADID